MIRRFGTSSVLSTRTRVRTRLGWVVGAASSKTAWVGSVALLLAAAHASFAREWPESLFQTKTTLGRPFTVMMNAGTTQRQTVIGVPRFYIAQKNDTLLDIARYYDVGYNEITEANVDVDPWIPKPQQVILVPTEWVLPEAEFKGLVLNIPEMRLYYFSARRADPVTVLTFPVGLGRDEWRTPRGRFRIRGKTVNPTWVPTESIKAEHRREGRPVPDSIPGGAPDNPLGKYRLELTLPRYGIHGTDIPWGVGMQVSHGCVRLYPEDIERLFPMVKVGTPGEFVYQPVKVGMRGGHVFVEVHRDIYGFMPGLYREAVRLIDKLDVRSKVNPDYVEDAVLEQSGVPVDVTLQAPPASNNDSSAGPPEPPRVRSAPPTPRIPW